MQESMGRARFMIEPGELRALTNILDDDRCFNEAAALAVDGKGVEEISARMMANGPLGQDGFSSEVQAICAECARIIYDEINKIDAPELNRLANQRRQALEDRNKGMLKELRLLIDGQGADQAKDILSCVMCCNGPERSLSWDKESIDALDAIYREPLPKKFEVVLKDEETGYVYGGLSRALTYFIRAIRSETYLRGTFDRYQVDHFLEEHMAEYIGLSEMKLRRELWIDCTKFLMQAVVARRDQDVDEPSLWFDAYLNEGQAGFCFAFRASIAELEARCEHVDDMTLEKLSFPRYGFSMWDMGPKIVCEQAIPSGFLTMKTLSPEVIERYPEILDLMSYFIGPH